jgi:ribokinase
VTAEPLTPEAVSPQVAVVGSLNFDLTFRTRRFPHPGEAVAAARFHSGPGGKGLNQAIAAARLGVPAALVGCIGLDPPGDEMVAALEADSVDVSGLLRSDRESSGTAAVIVTDDGENAIVVAPGANDALTEEHVHRHGRLIGDAKVLLVQLEIPIDAVRAALEIARGTGTLAILNAAPTRPVSDEVLRLADLVVVNEGEAAAITGEPFRLRDDPDAGSEAAGGSEAGSDGDADGDGDGHWAARAAADLVGRGCAAAVVTLGARGAWYADHKRRLFVTPHSVDAVDTTGAGDAFCGALAASLALGQSMAAALMRASAAGALAATTQGAAASLPLAFAVDELIAAP